MNYVIINPYTVNRELPLSFSRQSLLWMYTYIFTYVTFTVETTHIVVLVWWPPIPVCCLFGRYLPYASYVCSQTAKITYSIRLGIAEMFKRT